MVGVIDDDNWCVVECDWIDLVLVCARRISRCGRECPVLTRGARATPRAFWRILRRIYPRWITGAAIATVIITTAATVRVITAAKRRRSCRTCSGASLPPALGWSCPRRRRRSASRGKTALAPIWADCWSWLRSGSHSDSFVFDGGVDVWLALISDRVLVTLVEMSSVVWFQN